LTAGGGGPFRHGVASGDPLPDAVVLWTRVTVPEGDAVPVRWRVSRSSDGGGPAVAEGHATASAEDDFTVKVDVGGLEPATTYHYRFEVDGAASPVGRTRTAPSGQTAAVRLGVVSCANWAHGLFTAYRHLAEREVDLVVHLGDYVYESDEAWTELGRSHNPAARLRTLADYRARHAQYRTDPDLRRLHERHPLVAVWDDHDVAGNAWRDGAADHDPASDGPWPRRRAAATRAFLEWLPVRTPDRSRPGRIYRSFALGDLVRLIMLDTRLEGRDRPAADGERPVATVESRSRSLLGDGQRRWLRDELRAPAAWRVLGNQVMMAPLRLVTLPGPLRRFLPGTVAGGAGVNAGQWDGYPRERRNLFEFVERAGVSDIVVLTGDLHSSWASELTLDPTQPSRTVGVELVTPSITSRSFAEEVAPPLPGARALLRRVVRRQNPHVRFFDLERHGYLVVDVDHDRVRAEWWHVDGVTDPAAGETRAARWVVRRGDPLLVEESPADR
jgi:alkaline phosphatase D